ncbi:hypothetical protein NPX13_g3223 [Xylaria arbuscula]|uniref:Uncharacterized protein n=1 Tax=Xylaria arbuscula TaxID=114810 RepID=A0A9W8NIL8_9PEZI|nr:hypothetical protein NPX13_g3223 [Xylaria arbuscula]
MLTGTWGSARARLGITTLIRLQKHKARPGSFLEDDDRRPGQETQKLEMYEHQRRGICQTKLRIAMSFSIRQWHLRTPGPNLSRMGLLHSQVHHRRALLEAGRDEPETTINPLLLDECHQPCDWRLPTQKNPDQDSAYGSGGIGESARQQQQQQQTSGGVLNYTDADNLNWHQFSAMGFSQDQLDDPRPSSIVDENWELLNSDLPPG